MTHDETTLNPSAAPAPPAPPAGDTPAASAESSAESSAEAQVTQLQNELAALRDAFLRAKAETENIRRRADEDVAKARKFAIESFAESLLPVMDSLQAAVAQPDAAPAQVLEGVHATLRQLGAALERNRVIEIAPPVGTRFDPHQHQAISVVPADQEPHTVVALLQRGYLIADRVLRPALVTVSAPKQ